MKNGIYECSLKSTCALSIMRSIQLCSAKENLPLVPSAGNVWNESISLATALVQPTRLVDTQFSVLSGQTGSFSHDGPMATY